MGCSEGERHEEASVGQPPLALPPIALPFLHMALTASPIVALTLTRTSRTAPPIGA